MRSRNHFLIAEIGFQWRSFQHSFRLLAGHGESSGSFEYLVFRSVLEGVAKENGFTSIVDYQDPKLDRLFQEVGLCPCD